MLENGDTYEGEVNEQNEKEGTGTYYDARSRTRYVGAWKHDQRCG